jgi:hypothetical protein
MKPSTQSTSTLGPFSVDTAAMRMEATVAI